MKIDGVNITSIIVKMKGEAISISVTYSELSSAKRVGRAKKTLLKVPYWTDIHIEALRAELEHLLLEKVRSK